MKEITKYKVSMVGVFVISPILYIVSIKFLLFNFICPSLILNNKPCYLCGTSRAIGELFKFNLDKSLEYNHLGIFFSIYYVILLVSYVLYLFKNFNLKNFHFIVYFLFPMILFIVFPIAFGFL